MTPFFLLIPKKQLILTWQAFTYGVHLIGNCIHGQQETLFIFFPIELFLKDRTQNNEIDFERSWIGEIKVKQLTRRWSAVNWGDPNVQCCLNQLCRVQHFINSNSSGNSNDDNYTMHGALKRSNHFTIDDRSNDRYEWTNCLYDRVLYHLKSFFNEFLPLFFWRCFACYFRTGCRCQRFKMCVHTHQILFANTTQL